MAKIISLHRKSTSEIGCTACGATVDAACDCGAPYMPAGQRAAEVAKANPGLSSRELAEAANVSQRTAARAKQSVEPSGSTERVIGADGKSYPATRRPRSFEEWAGSTVEDFEIETAPPTPEEHRVAFMIFSNEAMLLAKYNGPIDEEVLAAARATATAWCRLVSIMENTK